MRNERMSLFASMVFVFFIARENGGLDKYDVVLMKLIQIQNFFPLTRLSRDDVLLTLDMYANYSLVNGNGLSLAMREYNEKHFKICAL